MFPFVLVGKAIASLKPLREEYDIFMLLPTYGIGGAERANGAVVDAVSDQKTIIYFTRHSPNDGLRHLFDRPHVKMVDISRYTDNKWIYFANFIYRGICAYHINRQRKVPVVFNGQCNFAYKLFPHLKKEVLKTELIHTSERKFSWVTFPYVPFIDHRVMVADNIINQHLEYYRELGIDSKYDKRISKIFYTIHVPDDLPAKAEDGRLRVYYAGRGGYQKRLDVLFEIIRRIQAEALPVDVHLAGSFRDEIPEDIFQAVQWHGQISSTEEMYALHKSMDVYLLTSRFEGFPLAIMEAMSCGVAIVATAVDGIPEHIKDDENGLLIRSREDYEIVEEGLAHIKKLLGNQQLRRHIATTNHNYAKKYFGREVFVSSYRRLFRLD